MSTRDSERRVQSEIEGVFAAYGIEYEHSTRGKHPAYEFTVNGKRIIFPYSGGDPRAHLNARSDVRNLLRAAGCKEIQAEVRAAYVEAVPPEIIEAPPNVFDEAEESQEQENHVDLVEMPPLEMPKAVEPTPPIPLPPPSQVPTIVQPIAAPPLAVRSGHTYQSGRVLGIKLDRDLLVTAGNVLVIPLNKPNTITEMTEEQFLALFEFAEDPLPPQPPAPTVTKRRFIAKADESVLAPEPESGPDDELYTPPQEDPPIRNYETAYNVNSNGESAGVPAQIARMLAAMAQVRRVTGKDNISTEMVSAYLEPRDFRQFSARMPKAIERQLVERGLPYTDRRGWHFKLTAKGDTAVKQAGVWPYTVEQLPVPAWMLHL
jgi:hypothetical protein